MKISRDWLSDFIDLDGLSDDEISTKLTSVGHAVEGIERHGDDAVFEVEFTTNRIDAMSHLGLARELAATTGRELRRIEQQHAVPSATSDQITIAIEAPELCTRFSARIVRNVKVKPSSARIQRRLQAVGLRPINNIVDITNYVMLSTGHPLHAYDLAQIADRRLVVRAGRPGEKIRSLDGQDRAVDESTAVIADGQRAVGLGGIIGGQNSEISEQTTDVLIECAHFQPSPIRRTARRLGLKTDASYRFERGADPSGTVETVMLAAQMMETEAGGTPSDLLDLISSPVSARQITLRDRRLLEASGGALSSEYALSLFRRLGMKAERAGETTVVEIPTYRVDLLEEIDLIEEALRFHGFNNIAAVLPRVTTGDVRKDPHSVAGEKVRDTLMAAGLSEVVTYSFIHPEHDALFNLDEPLKLVNALTENLSVMRQSIFPGLLEVVAHNRSYGTRDGAIFEVGKTYHKAAGKIEERPTAGLVMFGTQSAHWGETKRAAGFFELKGAVEAVTSAFRVPVTFESASLEAFKANQSALARSGGKVIARLGVLESRVTEAFGVKGEIFAADIDIAALLESVGPWKMTPSSKFPGIPMVLGLLHARSLTFGEIVSAIRTLEVPHLSEIGLWDRYEQDGDDQIKTALGLWYQTDDRSLTQDEVLQLQNSLAGKIVEMLPVKLIGT